MNQKRLFEVCCGSVDDALTAWQNGADRIEYNSALPLGGLTPEYGGLKTVLSLVDIPLIAMVRSRPDGFCYSAREFEEMVSSAKWILDLPVAGIAFGMLNEDGTVDQPHTRFMVELCHAMGKQFVFHRAIEDTPDIDQATETLIQWKVDRVLTSGRYADVGSGCTKLIQMQKNYGASIEILAGCGLTIDNVDALLDGGIVQVHGTCKTIFHDPSSPHTSGYPVVDGTIVKRIAAKVHR